MINLISLTVVLQSFSIFLGLLGAMFSAFEIGLPFQGEQYIKQVGDMSDPQDVKDFNDSDEVSSLGDAFGVPQIAFRKFPETTQQFKEWELQRKRSLRFGLICVVLSTIMQFYLIFFPSSTPPKLKSSNHAQPATNRVTQPPHIPTTPIPAAPHRRETQIHPR
jgi:hypothetical protein